MGGVHWGGALNPQPETDREFAQKLLLDINRDTRLDPTATILEPRSQQPHVNTPGKKTDLLLALFIRQGWESRATSLGHLSGSRNVFIIPRLCLAGRRSLSDYRCLSVNYNKGGDSDTEMNIIFSGEFK